MKVYLNIKTSEGVETVDELNRKDFKSFREFLKEKIRLKKEYFLCGSYYNSVYWSQRCTKEWRN